MIKHTCSHAVVIAALGGVAVLGHALVAPEPARAQGSATVGSLRGLVRDKQTAEPAVNATIVATSPALQGEQIVITDETGQYFLTALPPGVYTLTVYHGKGTFSRGNVLIQIGKEAVVNMAVDMAATVDLPTGEIVELAGTAPIVDQGSTKTGVSLADDYTRNIPTARTFGGIIAAAAGAQADFYGISLSGATSAENVYIVEGLNTTDTGFGVLSSNLPTEFIAETEVITGGYNAEFGRATGGIINVVTKQGSNEFHGSVFGYYRPGFLVSEARLIQREGGSIDTATNLDYQFDLGAELGGPIVHDKLWFHVGLNPSVTKRTTTRFIQRQVDEDQDGVPDVDEATGFTIRDRVSRSEIPRELQTNFFTVKVNGAVDQDNQYQISLFGNPGKRDDLIEHSSVVTRNPAETRWHVEDGAYDLAGKWTSKLNDGKTQIDAVLGHHRGFVNQGTLDGDLGITDAPFVSYNYERSLYDFRDLEGDAAVAGCQDSDDVSIDPYPQIRNCPVFDYAEGGLSFLERRTNTRTAATLALSQRVKAAGTHVLKGGLDVELVTYDSTQRYTGGQRWRRSADSVSGDPGVWQLREFYRFVRNLREDEDPNNVVLAEGQELCADGLAVCQRADQTVAATTNRNLGAFVQDSWQIRPNLTLNLGVRWEQQVGYVADQLQGRTSPEGETIPSRAYQLDNLLAPRVGFIYDPTREGKSKLFGHYGQFYETVPMDINVRTFGGEVLNFNIYNFNQRSTPECAVDHTVGESSTQLVQRLSMCQDRFHQAILGGGRQFVSPGLDGQRTDEIVLGAEYEILSSLTVGANYMRRTMPVVIEDISVDAGNTYLITNPGRDFSGAAQALERQAQQLMASSDPRERALGKLYQSRADQLNGIDELDKPVRDYDALQLLVRQRPTRNSLLLASYTRSHTRGNYPGLFSTETLQLDPNVTSLYDLPELMGNRYGKLGHDRPHNLKIDGFYLFDLKASGQLVAGAGWRTLSGIPHNVLAAHPVYGERESYLLPRGSAPRSPTTHQLDLRLAYGIRVNEVTMVEAFVNVFNVFDQQDELDADDAYTFDPAQPILGGRAEDLEHVKQVDVATGQELNATVRKNKNFGKTTVRSAPRNVQLGFRVTF